MASKKQLTQKYKTGDIVKFKVDKVRNGQNVGMPVGTELKILNYYFSSGYNGYYCTPIETLGNWLTGNSYWFYEDELELRTITVSTITQRITDVKQKIKELNSELHSLEEMISFMKKNSLTEVSETELKIYKVLDVINENSSQIEKMKAIASIIQ